MREQQWDGILDLAPLVDEMHIICVEPIDVDFRREVRQLIQLGFVLAPVVAIGPVFGQPLDLFHGWAAQPGFSVRKVVGEVEDREFLLEAEELRVRDRDGVGLDGVG